MTPDWYRVQNVAEVPSPSLLVYPDRVAENVRRMIAVAGGAARLRPHMKTHKMPDVSASRAQRRTAARARAEVSGNQVLRRGG